MRRARRSGSIAVSAGSMSSSFHIGRPLPLTFQTFPGEIHAPKTSRMFWLAKLHRSASCGHAEFRSNVENERDEDRQDLAKLGQIWHCVPKPKKPTIEF